ncbi:(E)-4-hydroxy-3-methylbut-2-enyl-diphosphate synthase [Kamptonema cortianum]|uniref:4-hydroxy-3-methylbut-2-en-1-yl diphosphate synthase (ferredoxin) n=1 Tax=Geitlerinema calcuttense NRMC-F 0142 TaxID=2922238 RepID=A0ABT7M0U9_9CYAN|nr:MULTISPECIES: (E)-4-hydroxy-3-methylbut-2-enyl-diphosphate synthase [Cyanophyceae]MDK3161815.1 (E)-4-hydroxy-3-methylbut-2-enyl-diphosphate synthase [Kamptonema cortianum]MDL5054386.1 (E)-4-hydroxy-3-methylbut-2-enyl-diphosphate synthase [Oscillatoria laete-virens NRMC-F 0139]MDL5057889.1 (E)-4-hydroxy-3-methylbut-2-enyl-diphosphate synthase [Geitlerinema calcuttense NRMC-F 0142]
MSYCRNPFIYHRRMTREVVVGTPGQGAVYMGANHPIVVQSMITSDTMDTAASVQQTLDLARAGCQIVRITAPTVKDAANLENIVKTLRDQGCMVPIVADIHFKPEAAMEAVKWVEGVRVNPGNYADKKKFAVLEYTDEEYQKELDRIEEAFKPLVFKCLELGRAMRIGTNHGSLSDRIMNRFGDTPRGMVESALEFARIARKYGFHNFNFSMKSSNPKVMIEAYRLLVKILDEQGPDWNYPLHLGVTEAGDGEDGRIKSAIGIGALLDDGIGDTIRVSLTEDAIYEVPVALALVEKYNARLGKPEVASPALEINVTETRDPYSYQRRPTGQIVVANVPIGGEQTLRVEVPVPISPSNPDKLLGEFSRLRADELAFAEIVNVTVGSAADIEGLKKIRAVSKAPLSANVGESKQFAFDCLSLVDKVNFQVSNEWTQDDLTRLVTAAREGNKVLQIEIGDGQMAQAEKFLQIARKEIFHLVSVAVSGAGQFAPIPAYRILAAWLQREGYDYPLQLVFDGTNSPNPLLEASTVFGSLLCDGFGDSVRFNGSLDALERTRISYNILQAAGCRTVKTDYVACPSCGRTLFNLQSTTARIKAATSHLKGVKIAVMGCIVNGPGEMADADFGYVGGAPGKINLYVGKTAVKFNIPEEESVQRLVDLIKEHGKWVDAPVKKEPAAV